jgi:class 3 adenylate cyclase/tetratricopeptide (TPR) repeat protein
VVEDERRVVTALFCDLVGSTSLGERTDPEELDRLLADYYDLASSAIGRHGGTVEKFIGDAVVALFGYPAAHEDDAKRALRAALEIVDEVAGSELEVEVRLGVNTGEAFLRLLPSGEWNATGDVMNTAARLQSAAPPMGVVVGERTRSAALRGFEFAQLRPLELRGKDEPFHAWRLVRAVVTQADEPGIAALIGRTAEIGRLTHAVTSLDEQGGGVLMVEGEPGIGKSRLVREARDSADGITWLRGRSIETRDAGGYRPFAELIRAWAEGMSWPPLLERARALGLSRADAGFLATMAGIEPDAGLVGQLEMLDAEAMRPSLYRSVLAWLDALSATRPVVLEFEDWHWADGASVQLAAHILPLVETRPLLLLLVARPRSEPARALGESAPDRIERLELAPLGPGDAQTLLAELVSGHEVTRDQVSAALGRAEGNPYFLYELSRFLTEGSRGAALPDSVRAVITTRVDRLEPDLKALLRTASVIGRAFSDDLLARMWSERPVQEALERLVSTGLIEPSGEARHRFAHALTREAIYDSTPVADRRRLHSTVAEALSVSDDPSGLPAIAYHLAQAEDWEAAAAALVAAGAQAARLAADEDALEMYRAAIEAHEHLPADRWGPLERSRIDRQVAAALVRLGRHDEALGQIVIALARLGLDFPEKKGAIKRATLTQLAPRLLGPPALPTRNATADPVEIEIGRELELLGWIAFFSDHDRFALATLMLANRASRAGFLDGMAVGTFRSAVAFSSLGKEKLARAYMLRALEAADRMTDEIEIARLKQGLSIVPIAVGGWDEASHWAELGMNLGAAAGDLRSRGSGGALFSLATAMHDDYPGAYALANDAVRAASEGGERSIQGIGHAAQTILSAVEPEVGAGSARTGIEVALQVPDYLIYTICLGTLARAQVRLGDLQEAASSIQQAKTEIGSRGFRGFMIVFGFQAEAELALLELARSRTRATVAGSRRAVRRSLGQKHVAHWHSVHAHAMAGGQSWLLGKRGSADKSFARARAIADRHGWYGPLREASDWIDYCCAEAGIEKPADLRALPEPAIRAEPAGP